jgi:hypothetical protein
MILFDKPVDLALLRMFQMATNRWRDVDDVKAAVDWLRSEQYTPAMAWAALRRMEHHGLVLGRKRPDGRPGREWHLTEGAGIKRATGGLDPRALDREDILAAGQETNRKAVNFTPDSYKQAIKPEAKVERAIKQCPSPWEYGRRMSTINYVNPEL